MAESAAPVVTSLSDLRRTAAAPEAALPTVRAGFSDLQGFELAQRAGRALSASTLIPQQFQGNLPNCLIALEMSQRIGASPLMVMQNLYIVHGRPGWSAKFLIASFNQCGRFSAIRYEWSGERGKDTWGCKAWAVEKATGEKIEGPTITIQLAKDEGWYGKSGSKWKTIPELMLQYRAAAWLVNTHAPEISMGLNTAEEMGDTFDAAPYADGSYGVTTDSLRAERAIVDVAATDATPAQEADNKKPAPAEPDTKKPAAVNGPTIHDALGLVRVGQYDDALAFVAGKRWTDTDRAEVESAIKRHGAGEKV